MQFRRYCKNAEESSVRRISIVNEPAALHKILQIRENEKKNAEQAHQLSVQKFEEIAMKMYETLKKKESTEEDYEDTISRSISIEKMDQQIRYIEQLNQHISFMQKQVNDARDDMDTSQQLVTKSHIEMKKVEKLIEIRNDEFKQQIAREESAFMDELSIQQFLKRKLGESIV